MHKMCASLQNKRLSCGIFGNNYDLEECAPEDVVQIFAIICGLRLTSAALPRAELAGEQNLPASKTPRTRCQLVSHIPYLDPFALRAVC